MSTFDSGAIRMSHPAELKRLCEENIADFDKIWHEAASKWRSGQRDDADQHFKTCSDILVGLAGRLCESAGVDMHVCKREVPR